MRRRRKALRPVRGSDSWRSRLPGVLILVALVVVSTTVFFLDTIRRALTEGPEITVLAAEARGLTPGADVWVAGSPSGRVTGVDFDDPAGPAQSRVVIQARLHWAAIPSLGADTEARIASSALLAPVVLKLDPGGRGDGTFDSEDTLTVPPLRSTDQLLSLATAARGAVDTLMMLSRELTDRLTLGPGTAAGLRGDTALVRRMRHVSAHSLEVYAALRSEDALPSRMAADSLAPALTEMFGALRSLADEEQAEDVTSAVTVLAERLERISSNMDRLDRDLRAGRGTAGRALYDDEIARQRAGFEARLDSLKSELRRKPWRWLRFKLF